MSIKQTVEEIYKTNTSYSQPEQVLNQVGSLKYLSADLYTDSKRFIYELLQNADDSSIDDQSVDIEIKLFGNKLVVAHTGKIFDEDDIKGICGIDIGTKKLSIKKTGYKGIGFKSVFGQSDKVTIFSDNEYFKFDAKYDFGWRGEWGSTQERWEKSNNRIFSHPWQIIPIYTSHEEIDANIKAFINTKWSVATIIDLISEDEIEKAIEELSSNVNMFLFLKNINSIKFTTTNTVHIVIDRKKSNEITLSQNNKTVAQWLIKTINLEVSNALKKSLQDERNIPDKLLKTDNIDLTMAIKKGKEGLVKLSNTENLLYAYLPTDEKRYSLPILVNTTFLMSANRESLHADSKWNQWLFMSIGNQLLKWIALLVKKEYSYQAYQLIPKKLLVRDDLSNAYNSGIEEAIKTIPFILSNKNELLKVHQAIIDTTLLSEKTFINSKVIRKFIIDKSGTNNKIAENPFLPRSGFNGLLQGIGVSTFEWSDIPAFFAFDNFISDHSIDKNIQLISYFKNESEIKDSPIKKKMLKGWAFILDHKSKLNHPNKIYFPTPNDTTWNNSESTLSFLHEEIQKWLLENQNIRVWLEKLGIVEKTDITFLEKTIIPDAENYITEENALETIQTIYNLYKKENINDKLAQLSTLKLLTKSGNLSSAIECYFSNSYNPRLQIEEVMSDDIFLHEDYLGLDSDKDEIRHFFKLLGVKESISLLSFKEKVLKNSLIEHYGFKEKYFTSEDKKFSPFVTTFTADTYQNINTLYLLSKTNTVGFSKLFWKAVIPTVDIKMIIKSPTVFWGNSGYRGRVQGDPVLNYLQWYIQNNRCIPTKKGVCKKSTSVFINSKEITELVSIYLPVFDGEELDNQNWKSFFNFKTELKLLDYLKLLSAIIDDKTDEGKIKESNKKRLQLVFSKLLNQSENWDIDKIEEVKTWSRSALLVDESYDIINCKELNYYVDGDNSIFQDTYSFIVLSEENKAHPNIESFLGYLNVEILKQDNFDVENKGEKLQSDLKQKLESIFPYFEKWIAKIDIEFTEEQAIKLRKTLDKLQVYEVQKLSLSYNGNILKTVEQHIENNELIVKTPWNSNKALISLTKVLCDYFGLKGYQDKLDFLLREDDESEIIEYFENENIEQPTINIPNYTIKKTTKNHLDLPEIDSPKSLASFGITSLKDFEIAKESSPNLFHSITPTPEMFIASQKLIKRAMQNIKDYLKTLPEYDCEDIGKTAPTILGGIIKNGQEISIVTRPSDDDQIVIYYESEKDVLEVIENELWYENGNSKPQKMTLGKLLKHTEITRVPV